MKVKIGNHIYNSDTMPLMIILNSEEKELISNMDTQTRFCCFPEEYSAGDIEKFMEGTTTNVERRAKHVRNNLRESYTLGFDISRADDSVAYVTHHDEYINSIKGEDAELLYEKVTNKILKREE